MGSSVSTYIGPYVIINLKETTYDRNVTCCTNMVCKDYHEEVTDAFCRLCGGMIIVSTVSRTGSLDWRSFDEHTNYAYEAEFYSPEFLGTIHEDIVICDSDGMFLDEDGGCLPLSTATFNVTSKLQDFETKHKIPLDAMKAYFPPGHVTTEYGICSYWS